MFFVNLQGDLSHTIDGVKYEITNGTKAELDNCKGAICEIYNFLDDDAI